MNVDKYNKVIIVVAVLLCALITPSVEFPECLETDGCRLIRSRSKSNFSELQSNTPTSSNDKSELLLTCRSFIDAEFSVDVKTLLLCKYHNTTFYLNNVVKKLPNVQSIIIYDSTVSYLIGPDRANNITLLQINNSTLKRIADNLLQNLNNLHVLDLRNNSLTRLPTRFSHYQHFKLHAIYLSKNKWNCSVEHLKWTWNITLSLVKDLDIVECYEEPFNGKPIFHIAQIQKSMLSECPRYCECDLFNIVRDFHDILNPIISVHCANQGLLHLPTHLPNLTRILHLENNSISDLSPIVTNGAYNNLQELYLDYNNVHSIAILEGGDWLERFGVLSLRSNKLVQLPTYALDHALTRNENMPDAVMFYLGDNPWRCDCAYTPHFQEMLMKYEAQIKDLSDVRCRFTLGDENSLKSILSLTRTSICRPLNEHAIKLLDLINIILGLLIVLVLGKLAYDYYFFRKTGRLPWIVSKMP